MTNLKSIDALCIWLLFLYDYRFKPVKCPIVLKIAICRKMFLINSIIQ